MMVPKIISFILIAVCSVFAARPFNTDDAGTVAACTYELELGYDLGEGKGNFALSFKHGLTEKMDIGIGFGFNIISEPKNSFLPVELTLKYALIPDLLAASFTAEFGGSAYILNGIMTRVLGPLEFDANFGYTTGDSSITYAGGLIYSAGDFAFGAEVLGDKEMQSWLVGGRYTIRDGLVVDVGFLSDFEFKEKITTIGLRYEF